jgi:hypothetical protein
VFRSKRLASFVVCLALVCAADSVGYRGYGSAILGSDALAPHRTGSVPAVEFWSSRVLPRLFIHGQQTPSNEQPPAVGIVRTGIAAGEGWTDVCRRPTGIAARLAVHARGERGPPQHVRS